MEIGSAKKICTGTNDLRMVTFVNRNNYGIIKIAISIKFVVPCRTESVPIWYKYANLKVILHSYYPLKL